MSDGDYFPQLPDDWEATRATLHAYANAVGSIPRAGGIAHPKCWHISLKVRPEGLVTDSVAIPGGGSLALTIDPHTGDVVVRSSRGEDHRVPMGEGLTGTEMGDRLIETVTGMGLQGEFNREKFENDDPREYSPDAARAFFSAAVNASTVFERHRVTVDGPVGPVQLWPHGFDLACEWFGTRVETYEEGGQTTEYPSQINLGFYPGGRPYFYSNPWPFDNEVLTAVQLPSGAEWHTDGWEGSILYYDQLVGDPDAADKLLAYARAVYDVAAPTLMR